MCAENLFSDEIWLSDGNDDGQMTTAKIHQNFLIFFGHNQTKSIKKETASQVNKNVYKDKP